MLKKANVRGLHGKYDYDIDFNNDLTLFTGHNGSGKTSLLKLVWCMISPNRGALLRELRFEYARVETDRYILELTPRYKSPVAPYTAQFLLTTLPTNENIDARKFMVLYDDDSYVRDGGERIEELNEILRPLEDRTLFFPTYRRIEGGFNSADEKMLLSRYRMPRYRAAIADVLDDFSESLSYPSHTFVTSISTKDVASRLADFKNKIDAKTNSKYLAFSKEVEDLISSSSDNGDHLAVIKRKLDSLKVERDKLSSPLTRLSDFVRDVFKDGGIKVSRFLTIGNSNSAVESEFLSAGEKQMFSFLSYNATLRNAIVFIDEPELSLHVDWQRTLFDNLLSQESTNQFIATTHSPFIYSRYPDKEIMLSYDRGCSE